MQTYIYILKYNLLNPYTIAWMYVFRTDHLATNQCSSCSQLSSAAYSSLWGARVTTPWVASQFKSVNLQGPHHPCLEDWGLDFQQEQMQQENLCCTEGMVSRCRRPRYILYSSIPITQRHFLLNAGNWTQGLRNRQFLYYLSTLSVQVHFKRIIYFPIGLYPFYTILH